MCGTPEEAFHSPQNNSHNPWTFLSQAETAGNSITVAVVRQILFQLQHWMLPNLEQEHPGRMTWVMRHLCCSDGALPIFNHGPEIPVARSMYMLCFASSLRYGANSSLDRETCRWEKLH